MRSQDGVKGLSSLTGLTAPVEYRSYLPDADRCCRIAKHIAIVAELADAHGSGPCTRKGVGVRVPSMAPTLSEYIRQL